MSAYEPRPNWYPDVHLPDKQWARVMQVLERAGTKRDAALAARIRDSLERRRKHVDALRAEYRRSTP